MIHWVWVLVGFVGGVCGGVMLMSLLASVTVSDARQQVDESRRKIDVLRREVRVLKRQLEPRKVGLL